MSDTGHLMASRCRVCNHPLADAGGSTMIVDREFGPAHEICIDAAAIAGQITNEFVWALVDTRELAPEGRAQRIELLCENMRQSITTAIVGAATRARGKV